jgi:membrane-associated phospholipid phosphatase
MMRVVRSVCCALVLAAGVAHADDERVPLRDDFPLGEQIAIAGVVVSDALLFAFQDRLSGAHPNGIGAPPEFDRRISESLYLGPDAGPWLGGVPDKTGLYVAPIATFAFYLGDSLVAHLGSHAFTGDENPDHKLLALVEAYGVAMGINQLVKVSVGRERPYYYLQRPQAPSPRTTDGNLSFYSGHSTSSFTLAAFVSRDLGDWLVRRGAGTWLGRVLPSTVLYGAAATVALSRVIDQAHYTSDVVVGSLTGILFGNLFYALHFDGDGRPRRAGQTQIVAFPGGLGLNGVF